MVHLGEILKDHCRAVGVMESIWHLTARETPRGNIGKLSNSMIAI
jgi:hypothetical protein